MNCLYCPKPLNGSDEHVIPSALGGRKSSRRILCSDCNKDFGSTIDAALLKTLEHFTLIVNPPSRRRENRRKLRVTDEAGDVYEMRAGGKLKIPRKRVAANQWIADASDAALLQQDAQRAADAIRERTGEKVEITSVVGEKTPGPFILPGQIDNFTATRAMLKWALNLLAMHVLTTDRSREPRILELERRFVVDGKAPPLAGYVERSLLPQLYEGLQHYVLLMQSANGSVYWEASAYGGVVAMAGRTAPIGSRFSPLLYVVDPVTGNSSMPDIKGDITDETCLWIPQSTPVVQERIAKAGVRLMQLMNGRIGIEALIEECMKEHVPVDLAPTQGGVNAFLRCIAEKYLELDRQLNEIDVRSSSVPGEAETP